MKNKLLLIIGILLLGSLPSVLAIDYDMPFDLWYLLVENVFGNFLLTVIALTGLLFLMGVWSRMASYSIYMIAGLFLMVMGVGYLGAIAAVPLFIFTLYYFGSAVFNYLSQFR